MDDFKEPKVIFNNTSSIALITIYLITVLIASTIIIPNAESIGLGVLQSIIWPLVFFVYIIG